MACECLLSCCCWMYKSTNFLANHNKNMITAFSDELLLDVQKY